MPLLALHEGLEVLRARSAFRAPGRPALAALKLGKRIPQVPARHWTYWADRSLQSHVGVLMGLDLVRNSGKYFLVEANLSPALHPKRRALYDTDLDPFITALCARARAEGLEHVVAVRGREWSDEYKSEFEAASKAFGVKFTGSTMARDARENLRQLPVPMREKVLYVICSGWPGGAPIARFLHEKWWQSDWMEREQSKDPEAFKLLAAIPTSLEPRLSDNSQSQIWPNLVLKLSGSDKGENVAMGRFESVEMALKAFGIDPSSPQSAPGVFGRPRRWTRDRNIFQPFIAPDLVDGHARIIRLNLLLSPDFDLFLSAHGVVSGVPVPMEHPLGLTPALEPYLVNFKLGARYDTLAAEIEAELVEVAREFGLAVRRAVSKRFETEPGIN